MAVEDKNLIAAPISLWGIHRREKGPKNPRPRCPLCRKTTYAARIDKARVKKIGKRKRGRPKKSESKRMTRHSKIGQWCVECEIFYYPDGTPNYKLRLRSKPRVIEK